MSTNPNAQPVASPQQPQAPQPRWQNAVAVTAAILAAMAAISSLLSTRNTNEAMIDQISASDQWAFYQAKGVKAAILESKLELLGPLGKPVDPADTERVARYKKEQETVKGDAERFQQSANDRRARAARFASGATASQIAIAMTAIALLTKKLPFWLLSLAGLVAGAVFVAMGLLM